MNLKEFEFILKNALTAFSRETPQLSLKLGEKNRSANERCVCFRLGIHLSNELKDTSWFVDSEYNLDLNKKDLKSLPDTGTTGRVMPDLIVHNRTADKDANIAVIEIKFKGDEIGIEDAKTRIKKFKEKFGYKVGVVIAMPKDHNKFVDSTKIFSF